MSIFLLVAGTSNNTLVILLCILTSYTCNTQAISLKIKVTYLFVLKDNIALQ